MPPSVDHREPGALAGWTVGITAARRREELGTALERRGAEVVFGPAIRIVPLADDSRLLEATERCLAAPLDFAVATTGVGFRGWMDTADAWGLKDDVVAALDAATILTRGPKVRGAVRATGLREEWSPGSESTGEVLDHMIGHYELAGRRVAVQLHGDPLRELVDALRHAGAEVIEVPVYRWEPPQDEGPLHRLIELTAATGIDALTFTSAPAAVNFLRTAEDAGLGPEVRAALHGPVLVAAVGPVTAAPLLDAGIPVIQPDRFRLGALVREVVTQLPSRSQVVYAAGHRIEIRGRAAVVDGELVPLSGADLAVLRLLAAAAGDVVPRATLAAALPGESDDGHAVDTAIGRLRQALGDAGMDGGIVGIVGTVGTVVERGYRLAAAGC